MNSEGDGGDARERAVVMIAERKDAGKDAAMTGRLAAALEVGARL